MLAHKFAQHMDKVQYPWTVQPKLNGVRMLYCDGQMQSRDEHYWKPEVLNHLEEVLCQLSPDFILDGELYKHGLSLQEINGAVSVNRVNPSPKTSQIQYHVFDCVLRKQPFLGFDRRFELLLSALSDIDLLGRVQIVPTLKVFDFTEAENQYAFFKRSRYEGMMYRDPYASYGLASQCRNKENRWTCLLKRKDFLDDEFPVIGILEGEGKYTGMLGSLVLGLPNGASVDVGSGFSDSERALYWREPPINKLCRIRYEMFSDGGIPLKPIFEAILD